MTRALLAYEFRDAPKKLLVENLTAVVSSVQKDNSSIARVLFENLTFEVAVGEISFITGKSGQGKSFLLRCIAGLEQPSAGGVSFSGLAVYKNPTAWRQRVMYIPASLPEYEGVPLDIFKRFQSFRAHRMPAEHPTLHPLAIGSRIGLSADLWNAPWSRLSSGERHRLYLAMALALQPDVLLLDEGLSPLDKDTSVLVERELRSYASTAIVWVTHNVSLIGRTPHGARISL